MKNTDSELQLAFYMIAIDTLIDVLSKKKVLNKKKILKEIDIRFQQAMDRAKLLISDSGGTA